MKIKKNLLFLLTLFFCLLAYADCSDCEAYKTQVANDCDSIVSSCNVALSDIDSAHGSISTAISIADNQTQISQLNSALTSVSALRGTLETLSTFALSIKSTAQALQCSTNNASGSCDCAPYLQSLSLQVSSIGENLISAVAWLDDISSSLVDGDVSIADYAYDISNSNTELMYILQDFLLWNGEFIPINISDFLNVSSNILLSTTYLLSAAYLTQVQKQQLGFSGIQDPINWNNSNYFQAKLTSGRLNLTTGTPGGGYDSSSRMRDLTLGPAIKNGFQNLIERLGSLNNYSYTNLFLFSSIHNRLTDISHGVSEITNQFSIFIDASVGASPVLSAYTSQDGSYHDYLTNYYIQVSGSSVSGSTPLTNWFNRIEMLLAALVFQDDDGPDTNAVPSSSSYDQVEDSLNQTFTSINQHGQDFLSTVDTSGKSILSMLREWNSAVSGVAKPSAFTIAEIPNSFSGGEPVRRDGSSNDLKLTLDTDNELFSGFVELVRGVTTLSWITLFLVVGYFLSLRIISLIGKLISFGYSVYSAIFGGG